MTELELLDMPVHGRVWISELQLDVVRVVGGWLYCTYDQSKDALVNGMFVPEPATQITNIGAVSGPIRF